MKISSHDARSSLSPRAGRGRGEGASTLLARCKSSPDRQDTPYQLRIAERPPQPILLPARGEKEPRAARGERWGERSRSRDACAPEACRPKLRILIAPKKKKGGGAPKRRDCLVGPRHAADVAIHLRFGRGRAFSGTRSPFGAPPRFSLRPCAEARSRPRFTRCSAQALPAPWHRA
jgi:hypothetical protein